MNGNWEQGCGWEWLSVLAFIRENTTLLLGMFLALFTLSLGGYRNPVLAAIARKGAPPDAFRRLKWPASVLARARRSRRWLFLILTAAFMLLFRCISLSAGYAVVTHSLPCFFAIVPFGDACALLSVVALFLSGLCLH